MSEVDTRPNVSVVIPLHDGEKFIDAAITSVLDQSYQQLEVVVVDDGSRDAGPLRVRALMADKRVRLFAAPHSGIASTRNRGLLRSDGDSRFVLFMDQDDLLAPDLIERLVGRLQARPDAVGAYAIADFIDATGLPTAPGSFARQMRTRRVLRGRDLVSAEPDADVAWPELFISNHLYPPSAVLLRRAHVVEAGGFDARYEVADDWDLMMRVSQLGPILPWDEVKVGYRRHGGNASGDRRRNVHETRAVWANTYYAQSRAERRVLQRWWRAHQRGSAKRKLLRALELIHSRRLLRALASAADGVAHLLLLRPLRIWRSPDERTRFDAL